jgi:murein DD-endopeptidase MepM/ murein hydrolase activator NlpD
MSIRTNRRLTQTALMSIVKAIENSSTVGARQALLSSMKPGIAVRSASTATAALSLDDRVPKSAGVAHLSESQVQPRDIRHGASMTAGKLAYLAAILVVLWVQHAWGFDFARYQVADLDELLEQRRPQRGVDIYPGRPLKLTVTLAAYAEGCDAVILKKTMIAAGIAKDKVEAMPVIRCIKVRSAKSRVLLLFIQSQVAEFLPREVQLGGPVTLYAIHVFTGPDGPGLLVNEFLTDASKPGTPAGQPAGSKASGCGCGTPDFHPGTDYAADEGTPVPAAEDGVVVKVEEDEQALGDTPSAGRCGRYVVIKHAYPNDRSVFTRYAQIGRLIGGDGKPIAVGMHVMRADKIGEVGTARTLHFEIRPVEPATMDTDPGWSQRYGADPSMEWSRFRPVDPLTFDFGTFNGTSRGAK